MKKLAIFDIDGTIFRSSLLIEVVESLIEAGIFKESARRMYRQSHKDWLDRKGSYSAYIHNVVEAFEKNIPGVPQGAFIKIVKEVIALHKSETYVYTRELIKELKKKRYYLLAISHSPRELVDEFCKHLGFDKVYGRIYEVGENKKFTGGTLYVDLIADKAKILKRFIEKENLSLADSYGVGDSESDIAFLTFVEHPICFNPNKKLYEHAKKAGWNIVVERKDVIYQINPK